MPTYLNNWNPDRGYKWESNARDSEQTRIGVPVRLRWSASGTKAIKSGDRVFLGRQGTPSKDGTQPRGVIAAGVAVTPFFEDRHWAEPSKSTTYNVIEFDTILTPETVLARDQVQDGPLATIRWQSERGGVQLDDDAAAELERRWAAYLQEIGFGSFEERVARRPYQPDPRKRKAVEEAAVRETIAHFRAQGFVIQDRQSDNVGWDLEAHRGEEHILLEVKGLSGNEVSVELTPNEYIHMQRNRDQYVICIVTGALGPSLSLAIFRYCGESARWQDATGRSLSAVELVAARLSA
jgi:hypothetical protein